MKIIELEKVNSTNTYAKNCLSEVETNEDIVIFSYDQTEGRGTSKNVWYTEKNKNIIMSVVVSPKIKIEDYFLISMLTSLAICDYTQNKGIFSKIKWPNDIYYNEKKLCGILIENTVYGDTIKNAVIGVGLNLNQNKFPVCLQNPISISNITGEYYDIRSEIKILSGFIINKLKDLNNSSFEEIKKEYLSKIFRFNEFNKFKTRGDIIFARIIDVRLNGNIVLETELKQIKEYYFKEIIYSI